MVNKIIYDDNLNVLKEIEDKSINLIYIDPPFNTGIRQERTCIKTIRDDNGDRIGYKGKRYRTIKGKTFGYNDIFDDYIEFLRPRLLEAYRILRNNGSLFFHIDYREVHYCKILLDEIFGRDSFMNEIIWAYDYGARSKKKWSTKHDNILWYVKNPKDYTFNFDEMDRIPYMAPGLVGKEKAARGKTPTDCFSEDTEILTENGWIEFKNLQYGVKVASVDNYGNLCFCMPIKYHKYEYSGDMIQLKSKTIDLLVTPNHKIYCKLRHKHMYNFVKACDLINVNSKHVYFSFMNKLIWTGIDEKLFFLPEVTYRVTSQGKKLGPFQMGDWCEFVGRYIADGVVYICKNRYVVTISAKKKRKVETLALLLAKLCINYSYNGKDRFNICNKQLCLYMKKFGIGAYKKSILREYLELDSKYLLRLYHGLICGDGHIIQRSNQHDNHVYATTSKLLADQVHEILIKIGYTASITKISTEKLNKKLHKIKDRLVIHNYDLYRVTRRISKESTIWPNRHISTIRYDGLVYCVTVEPYHTLVVRRNGRSAVCGNCWWHTIVSPNGKEKTGYATQKPLGILERIVKVHSLPGDVLLDFFAGSGTFGEAAYRHDRRFILVDNNIEAIRVMINRLSNIGAKYKIVNNIKR